MSLSPCPLLRLHCCADGAVTSLHDVAKFSPNEIGLFLLDPVTKELARVRGHLPTLALLLSSSMVRLGVCVSDWFVA